MHQQSPYRADLCCRSAHAGFFRVNYDTENWLLLAAYLTERGNPRTLGVATRVMLLDDALALARTGRLDHSTALTLANYLRAEMTEPEPFAAAREAFGTHLEPFLLNSKLHDVYKVGNA